ncbi:MAG: 50S ribosomal protein L32 [Deltaproteobacteria bacterium]|nr:50S ribosomal protein L32 [Deltaproteobacteria bacterium]
MPNPRRRHTRTKRKSRRSHDALSTSAVSLCPQCGASNRPHHVCLNCGTYKGRTVIKTEESV